MKTTLSFLLFFISLSVLNSCSDSDGYNNFKGTWKLQSVTVDGKRVDDYDGNIFWKFQDNVILMQVVDDMMHEREDHFGTWKADIDSSVLQLDFSHSDNSNPPGEGLYSPPEHIGLNNGVTIFEIERFTSSLIVLKYQKTDNSIWTYTLTRYV